MEAFLISTSAIALGELGDKTQLLAFVLAAKYKRPVPIVLGILAATLLNHTAAAALGEWIGAMLGPDVLRWAIGLSFLGMAVWVLIPDRIEDEAATAAPRFGVFGTTLITFFLAEMGDKTQIATVALGARFHELLPVVAGTTLGMMIADVPAVFMGSKVARALPMKLVHSVAAAIFAILGALTLLKVGPQL